MRDNKVTQALTEEIESIEAAILDLTNRKERAVRFLSDWRLDVNLPFTVDTLLGPGVPAKRTYLPKLKPGTKPKAAEARQTPKAKSGPKPKPAKKKAAPKAKVVATAPAPSAVITKAVPSKATPAPKAVPGRKTTSKTLSILAGIADVFASDPSNPRTTKVLFEALEAKGIHVGTQNPKNTLAAILSKDPKYVSSGSMGWYRAKA